MTELLVSLHIPKTGGSTLAVILEQRFGARLQQAYNGHDNPRVESPACIHGHDVQELYGELIQRHESVRWITFLREPLLSAISMYFYVRKRSQESSAPHFVDQGLDVWLTHSEPFRWPNPPGYQHNRYSRWLARHNKTAEQFDFIGLTDRFNESMFLLYAQLGWPPIAYTSHNEGRYAAPSLSEGVVERFRALNAEDYALYESALRRLDRARQDSGMQFERDFANFRGTLKMKA